MQIRPSARRRVVAAGADDDVSVVLDAAVELAVGIVPILEFQVGVTGPFEELVTPAYVVHLHPETQRTSSADIERRVLKCRVAVESVEIESAAELAAGDELRDGGSRAENDRCAAVAGDVGRTGGVVEIPVGDEVAACDGCGIEPARGVRPGNIGLRRFDADGSERVALGRVEHGVEPSDVVHSAVEHARRIAGVAADVHHAVDRIGNRRPVQIGGGRSGRIGRFDSVAIDAHFGGGVARKSGNVPNKLQIRPNTGRRVVAAGANHKIIVVLNAAVELAVGIIPVLELQIRIPRPFEELVAPAYVVHLHPETQRTSSADVERSVLEPGEIIDAVEIERAAELALAHAELRPRRLDQQAGIVVAGGVGGGRAAVGVEIEMEYRLRPACGTRAGIEGDGHLIPFRAVDRAVDVGNDSGHGNCRAGGNSRTADLHVADGIRFVARRTGIVDR